MPFCKILFNYARHTPLFIADMLNLRENDMKTWDYLKDNFSVSKSLIPFTSIGSDQAVEQQNKDIKVNGDIVGLTQKPSGLNWFCLAAPLMNTLSDQYCDKYNTVTGTKRTIHYQLTGSQLSRLCGNVKKLVVEMKNYDVTFVDNSKVFNVVSKAVLPEECATELLEHDVIVEEIYQGFIKTRLQGDISH